MYRVAADPRERREESKREIASTTRDLVIGNLKLDTPSIGDRRQPVGADLLVGQYATLGITLGQIPRDPLDRRGVTSRLRRAAGSTHNGRHPLYAREEARLRA